MSNFHRVTKRRPCPICGKPDWCMLSNDGAVAICPRTSEGSYKRTQGGYLHRVTSNTVQALTCTATQEKPFTRTVCWEPLAAFYEQAALDREVHRLAENLGVTERSLRRLHVGLCAQFTWTFPMGKPSVIAGAYGLCEIVGIRVRHETAGKWCVTGSHDGLFLPASFDGTGPLVICEGPTDCAAMLDLGFNAIGRSNCAPHFALIAPLAYGRPVIIVADNDQPDRNGRRAGQDGAAELAANLRGCASDIRVVTPVGVKDARAWKRAGLTRDTLLEAAYGNR